MKRDLKEIITDAKNEAMTSLAHAVSKKDDNIEYIRELATIHSDLCLAYYKEVENDLYIMKQQIEHGQRRYRPAGW